MKSSPRRSHSYWEGVMMFQRGGSMFGLHPPAFRRARESDLHLPPWHSLDPPEHGVEVAPPEQPVAIHRMPVGHDLAGPLPIAEGVRRDAEILGGLRDAQKVPQLGHPMASMCDC